MKNRIFIILLTVILLFLFFKLALALFFADNRVERIVDGDTA